MSRYDDPRMIAAVEAGKELDRDRDLYEKSRQRLQAEPLTARVVEILRDSRTSAEFKLGQIAEVVKPIGDALDLLSRRESLLAQTRTGA